jgi:hypothetical protein
MWQEAAYYEFIVVYLQKNTVCYAHNIICCVSSSVRFAKTTVRCAKITLVCFTNTYVDYVPDHQFKFCVYMLRKTKIHCLNK